ncbi:enolase C-terminal domain-like protein [Flexivirga oryzae]|uniref:L-alanine-DL-glutamate epimerase-like enolase superfamily enzyme n=1 Tax=Flexivirga oryzae TaxID=1794944 RepID=A0A839N9L0_9MICO|nr:L-alanine-DL-glutamate epimerase-like enolase superfamily enzyme [Flexivirga oryzae]
MEIPLDRTFEGGTYQVAKRCTVITSIRTDDSEIVGRVYNGDPRVGMSDVVGVINSVLEPMLVGQDPLLRQKLWTDMSHKLVSFKEHDIAMQALAGVDCALWDVIGKLAGMSVAELLGACRRKVPLIAIGGYYEAGKSNKMLGEEMQELQRLGVTGCKLKIGQLSPQEDAERFRAAREGAGPEFVLAADANRAWTVEQAVEFAHAVEDLNMAWFEEPCHWFDDVNSMRRVREKITQPVCAGQSEISSQGVRHLIENRAIDILNFDVSESGGVSQWRMANTLAELHGLAVGHHEESQIATHLLCSTRRPTYVECFAPDRDPVFWRLPKSGPRLVDGFLELPDGSGFGLELDEDIIEEYRV